MRVVLLALLVASAGCIASPMPASTTTDDASPTYSAPGPVMTCAGAGGSPVATLPTSEPGTHDVHLLVAHRDGLAEYRSNGNQSVAVHTRRLDLGFSDGLGYRFVSDGSAVFDHHGLHRFDGDLHRTAWWNLSQLGGAARLGDRYLATAGGRLYVLDGALVSQHAQAIPGWVTPGEPRYDVLLIVGDRLLVGSAGRPDALLIYDLADPKQPRFEKEVAVNTSQVPIGDANLGPTDDAAARPTPWKAAFFTMGFATPEKVYLWRDGAFQGNPAQTVSRFQDLVTVRRSDWTVERVDQQYLEDNHYGMTNGTHVGPIDATGAWALVHVRGTFSLASLMVKEGRPTTACQIDIHLSSFTADDVFFHRDDELVLTGTQARASAWNVGEDARRLAEIEFPRVATDVRAL
jgi:hypothetical protein